MSTLNKATMRYSWFCLFVLLTVTMFNDFMSAQTPHSLDSVVQAIQANQFANSISPEKIAKINSAADAQDLLNSITDLDSRADYAKHCDKNTVLIMHTAKWHVTTSTTGAESSYSLLASQYTVFSLKSDAQKKCGLEQEFGPNHQPLIYHKKSIYLIGINYFDIKLDKTAISITYKLSETATTPQNIQDLGILIAALTGVTLPSGPGAALASDRYNVFLAQGLVQSTAPPPYTISIAYGLQPATSQLPIAPVGTPYNMSFAGKFGDKVVVTDVQPQVRDQTGNLNDTSLAQLGLHFDSASQVLSGSPTGFGTAMLKLTLTTLPSGPGAPPGGSVTKGFTVTNSSGRTPPGNTGQGARQQMANQSTQTAGQPVDCSTTVSATPCSFTDTFNVNDREYWDVSLGLAIPGVKETVYTASSTAGTTPSGSTKTHTDAYAFVDYYFLAKYFNKIAFVPHVNGGIPVTSQPLHRPYIGLAWDISGWAQRRGFPIDLCVFGGVVFTKQQIFMPSNSNQLQTDWARKGLWGVEVPISGIAGKLSGKSSNKGSSKGGGQ